MTVLLYVTALLFELGAVGPCVFIAVATVGACAVVVPAVDRWAGGG